MYNFHNASHAHCFKALQGQGLPSEVKRHEKGLGLNLMEVPQVCLFP